MAPREPRHNRDQPGGHDPLLTVDEARARILAAFSVLDPVDSPILDALGQVLAEDVIATENLPLFANSAMDGYALRCVDISSASENRPINLSVQGEVPAGRVRDRPIEAGTVVRIMTGAPLPVGADAVVRFEDVEEVDVDPGGHRIVVRQPVTRWSHVRHAGEDVAQGSVPLECGTIIGPAHIGLLAALNRVTVSVIRRPRVAILSTGDEIVEPGLPLGPGQIRNSNSYLIAAMVRQGGGIPRMLGVARDDEHDIIEMLERARGSDLLLTSGGVSVGDFDLLKHVLRREGEIDLWRLRMRPGRIIAFGSIGSTKLLGLPGNPVAAAVAFAQFARPALSTMLGLESGPPRRERARLTVRLENRGGQQHFVRGNVSQSDEGVIVEPVATQGSGAISGLARANCFIVIPEGTDKVEQGAIVDVELFRSIE